MANHDMWHNEFGITARYISSSFDITANVGSGGKLKLNFVETDNLGLLNQGVDKVSITSVSEEVRNL